MNTLKSLRNGLTDRQADRQTLELTSGNSSTRQNMMNRVVNFKDEYTQIAKSKWKMYILYLCLRKFK